MYFSEKRGDLFMHFAGNQTLAISQTRAWQFLTDPDQVGKCVPGLRSIEVNTVAQKLTEKFFKGVEKKIAGGKKHKSEK